MNELLKITALTAGAVFLVFTLVTIAQDMPTVYKAVTTPSYYKG